MAAALRNSNLSDKGIGLGTDLREYVWNLSYETVRVRQERDQLRAELDECKQGYVLLDEPDHRRLLEQLGDSDSDLCDEAAEAIKVLTDRMRRSDMAATQFAEEQDDLRAEIEAYKVENVRLMDEHAAELARVRGRSE